MLFAGMGPDGQRRLLGSRATIVGCGAIGAAAANLLVRAGVGSVNIIDRDFVEPSNLQRQTLFDESDARNALPKAVAAEHKLRSINSGVEVRGVVADLGPKNAVELLSGCDLILDGTDNFETRFLINDFAVESGRVWIYAAAVASYGLTLTIRPGVTPCLACLLESGNSSQALEETCDTIGVLGPIVNLVASWQVAETLKILAGRPEALHGRLLSGDVWTGRMQAIRDRPDPDHSPGSYALPCLSSRIGKFLASARRNLRHDRRARSYCEPRCFLASCRDPQDPSRPSRGPSWAVALW